MITGEHLFDEIAQVEKEINENKYTSFERGILKIGMLVLKLLHGIRKNQMMGSNKFTSREVKFTKPTE